ncbi:hypothetical protein HBP99_04125 [Listeria booriae]|uniref:hypothetical protein n=1 Tax=Listeria booriae TaxID=1552123 RepID=UPI001629E641|nr:hypothetical protein [Listeria booriae]MBC2367807.1 hypothetical protein [Listeria booriae]
MTKVLLMGKKLSNDSEVRFYKEADGSYKFIVEEEHGTSRHVGCPTLTSAISLFKSKYRDASNEPVTSEEQIIIDQFNAWDGNLQEMGSI